MAIPTAAKAFALMAYIHPPVASRSSCKVATSAAEHLLFPFFLFLFENLKMFVQNSRRSVKKKAGTTCCGRDGRQSELSVSAASAGSQCIFLFTWTLEENMKLRTEVHQERIDESR